MFKEKNVDPREQLLDQIRNRSTTLRGLKKVNPDEPRKIVRKYTPSQQLSSALFNAMESRRKNMHLDPEDEETDFSWLE